MAKVSNNTGKPGSKDIHVFLSSKGGIGKSFCASLLAQYGMSIGRPMQVFDMDSNNQTLAATQGLGAIGVKIADGTKFRHEAFDAALESMTLGDGPYLLDVGASMFHPVWSHLVAHDTVALLESLGSRVVLHFPITGGQEAANTLASLVQVSEAVAGRHVVAWLNPYHGEVNFDGGKSFFELSVYQKLSDKMIAVIVLPDEDEAVKTDLRHLGQANAMLLDAEKQEHLKFFSKHRLGNYRKQVFAHIEHVWGAILGEREQHPEA